MLNIIAAVITGIILVIFISTFRFDIKEGKDERGTLIMSRAGMIALIAFFFGYSVTFTINILYPLTGFQYNLAFNFVLNFVPLHSYQILVDDIHIL